MRKGGRSVLWVVAALAAGALAVGGCSKLQTSLDKKDTVTLGDLAARVAALEQQVADLQAASGGQTARDQVEASSDGSLSLDATGETQGAVPANQKLAKGARAVVTAGGFLNVRQEPSRTAEKVATLREGATVQVIALEGDWAKVRFNDHGRTIQGWVFSQYLERQE